MCLTCVYYLCVCVHLADMRLYRKWNHIGKITRYQKKNAIYLHKIRSEPSLGDSILIFWHVILDQTTIESNIVQQQKEIWCKPFIVRVHFNDSQFNPNEFLVSGP